MKQFIFSLFGLGLCHAVLAAGDPRAGAEKSEVCAGCHGADGHGVDTLIPRPPRLAGQYADYLANALMDYKSKKRSNPVMGAFAATLSDDDIEDIAAYYSRLDSPLADLRK